MNKKDHYKEEANKFISSKFDTIIERLCGANGFKTFGIPPHTSAMFPGLQKFTIYRKDDKAEENIVESLKFILWQIYCEAVYAFFLGYDKLTIIACRSVVERALRIAYHRETGKHAGKRLSLGSLINECKKEKVSSQVTDLAEILKEEGNNLAHGLWETSHHWEGITIEKNGVACYITGDSIKSIISTRDLLKIIFKAT